MPGVRLKVSGRSADALVDALVREFLLKRREAHGRGRPRSCPRFHCCLNLQPAASAPNFLAMLKSSARSAIRLRGVRHNNLKNFDLDLPLNQLIVVTGLSGSGKSSLAFDTLFAEGQRRYIETFSPYARQFL